MNTMLELDGNAIGGELMEIFGADLTAASSVCAGCGKMAPVAETVVYMRGPGRVARCRTCGVAHIVLVTIRGTTCVDTSGIAEMHMPS